MTEEHMKTQVLGAASPAFGGFWIRFLAYVVDALIVGAGCVVIAVAAGLAGEVFALLATLVLLFGPILYFVALHASARQATYGKALVGLRVADSGGNRISFLRSLGRELAKIISAFPLMIGFLLAAFTQRKQALHDMVASTVVVRDSPGHVAAALAISLVGVAAPFVVMFVFGAALLMALMGGMTGGMLGDMAVQAPPKPPGTQMARPAPRKPAPPPEIKPAPPVPAAAIALSPEDEKLFGGGVAGMDAPSMTRAGPALLELSSFFASGPNVWVKVHVPPVAGMGLGRGRATVAVKSVTDPGNRDLYDAKSNFEQPFFHAIDLTETKSGVHRLQGIRSVRLLKGTTEAQVHEVEGVLSLALPLDVQTAVFRAADTGKPQTVAGMKVTATKLAGVEASVSLEAPIEALVDVRGFDAKGRVAQESSSYGTSGGSASRSLRFRGPIERIEVLLAPRFLKREYPFTLVRGAMPAPLPASLASVPPKPAAPAVAVAKVPEKPKPVPVAKVELPPPPPAVKAPPPPPAPPAAKAPPPPVAKVASALVTPFRAGPSAPGPRYADLMTAVMYRDAAGVEELLAFGKWPDRPDSRGLTPLAAAVMLGDAASAEALLKGGADPGTAWRVTNELNDPAMRALLERYQRR
jgi:uncharacterized RDD family membrane protein YckC